MDSSPVITQVDAEWVYYETYGESNDVYTSMFRVKKDGTGTQKLPNGFIRGSQIIDNLLIYSEEKKTINIMKTDLNGAEAHLLIKPVYE